MSDLRASLPRSCQHTDVGDCEPDCFGSAGQDMKKCWSCGEYFDLNSEGKYEHDNSGTALACPDCPLPTAITWPRVTPSLALLMEIEEGIRA